MTQLSHRGQGIVVVVVVVVVVIVIETDQFNKNNHQ